MTRPTPEEIATAKAELNYLSGNHPGYDWVVCPPCYDHLEEHFKDEPGPNPPWNDGVGLTDNKEECLLEGTGCVVCDKSHEAVLKSPTTNRFPGEASVPEDPCDSGFMKDIST